MIACSGDPEPAFSAPEITEVTVTAEAQSAMISFRVDKGKATACGVNLSEDTPGASVLRVEGSLNEGLAEVKLSHLTAGSSYCFTPWAENGKFEIKGEEQRFSTKPLADVRIYDFLCYSPTVSTISFSFQYTAPERVVSASLWYWPADAAGISDPAAHQLPLIASSAGKISGSLSGLQQNTAYCAQPFIYTEAGYIAGDVQQFSTSSGNISVLWDDLHSIDTIPHVIIINFSVIDHSGQNTPKAYFMVQEGDRITYDENTLIDGPHDVSGRLRVMYLFAKSGTQYTVLPFVRSGQDDILGTPRTLTTGIGVEKSIKRSYCRIWEFKRNVKDAALRKYLLESFDTDQDGTLNNNEINDVKHIDCRYRGIKSLEGLSRFQNVISIDCSGNPIQEIDLIFRNDIFGWCNYCAPRYLKSFTALDMKDSEGHNTLKYLVIGKHTNTKVTVPEECVVQYDETGMYYYSYYYTDY